MAKYRGRTKIWGVIVTRSEATAYVGRTAKGQRGLFAGPLLLHRLSDDANLEAIKALCEQEGLKLINAPYQPRTI